MDSIFCSFCGSTLNVIFDKDDLIYYCEKCQSRYKIEQDELVVIRENFDVNFNPYLIGTFNPTFFKMNFMPCTCGNKEYYVVSKDLSYEAFVCTKCRKVFKNQKRNINK